MKKLDNFQWKPMWASHIGCLAGCKDFLGVPVSDAAVYGGTGHAFIINMHAECCPSGPTAWMTEMLFDLRKNVGLESEVVFSEKHRPDFEASQKKAFDFAKTNLDAGIPCYGFELDMAEYYVVNGYDEAGYYFMGPGSPHGKGPAAWEKLGTSEIGILEMYNVKMSTVKSPEQILMKAFDAALKHANNTQNWILPNYRSGLEAYDLWIAALEEGKADQMGHSYNAGVWQECRAFAVQFLEEFQVKINGVHQQLVKEALSHYRVIAEQLKIVSDHYPFNFQFEEAAWPIDARSEASVKALKKAQAAEAAALKVLEAYVALG